MNLNIIDSKRIIESVAIITPTIGKDTLKRCVESVNKQTFKNIKHHIVIDGTTFADGVIESIRAAVGDDWSQIYTSTLSENVGANGWYGHRVYAAYSFLFNADAVCFLDEDNWFEPDHIEYLVNTISDKNLDWSFSFRKIFDKDGNYLFEDNCESLGIHPAYMNEQVYHIDTSSYMVRKDVAVRIGGAWYGQWGADRQYFNVLKNHFPEFAPSKKYSLCYRLDGNPGSVSKEFFEQGNARMKKIYGDNYPWMQD